MRVLVKIQGGKGNGEDEISIFRIFAHAVMVVRGVGYYQAWWTGSGVGERL